MQQCPEEVQASQRTIHWRIYIRDEFVLVQLNALNANTGTSASTSIVESITVAGGEEGKGGFISFLCKDIVCIVHTWCGSRYSIIPSILLVVIHINIELVTTRIISKSAFNETSTDINKHFLTYLKATNVLCEKPTQLKVRQLWFPGIKQNL